MDIFTLIRKLLIASNRMVRGFIRQPDAIKYAPIWVRSMLPWHTTLRDQVPFLPFPARIWLESYLKPEMSVFEWGSGGSTLFFAKRVKALVSVEHDKGWYNRLSSALTNQGISNCRYILHEPQVISDTESPSAGNIAYMSTLNEYQGVSFGNYVKAIDEYPDGTFDLIIIDGRSRIACISHALSKVRPGGCLMLDNSERDTYEEAFSILSAYKQTNITSVIPYIPHWGQTTIWEINPRS